MSDIITAADFKEKVLDSPIPVIVDFFATWCMPCKMLAPILDSAAAELSGSVKVVKVDIDQDLQLAERYNIQTVPTLVLIKDGKTAEQIIGVVPKAVIVDKIRAQI
jgi:thioredoxin 1